MNLFHWLFVRKTDATNDQPKLEPVQSGEPADTGGGSDWTRPYEVDGGGFYHYKTDDEIEADRECEERNRKWEEDLRNMNY